MTSTITDEMVEAFRKAAHVGPHGEIVCLDDDQLRSALESAEKAAWRPIEESPRDGTRFWGNVDDDAIAMFWHDGFGEFVLSFRRMTMAPGYTIDGAAYKDHSPTIHKPTHWMPRIPLPTPPQKDAE